MKYIILFLVSFPVYGQNIQVEKKPDGSMVVTLDKKAVERCDKENGCAVVSSDMIQEFAINTALKLCGKSI